MVINDTSLSFIVFQWWARGPQPTTTRKPNGG